MIGRHVRQWALILRADAEQIANTLFDHSHSIS